MSVGKLSCQFLNKLLQYSNYKILANVQNNTEIYILRGYQMLI